MYRYLKCFLIKQYDKWLMGEAPQDLNTFFSLMEKVKTFQNDRPSAKTVVMSMDGFGRPGTFAACYFLQQQYQNYMLKSVKPSNMSFTVFNLVRVLREQRYNMVGNYEQYSFLYAYLKTLLGISVEEKRSFFGRRKNKI